MAVTIIVTVIYVMKRVLNRKSGKFSGPPALDHASTQEQIPLLAAIMVYHCAPAFAENTATLSTQLLHREAVGSVYDYSPQTPNSLDMKENMAYSASFTQPGQVGESNREEPVYYTCIQDISSDFEVRKNVAYGGTHALPSSELLQAQKNQGAFCSPDTTTQTELIENVAYSLMTAQEVQGEGDASIPDSAKELELRENVAYCSTTAYAQQVQEEKNADVPDVATDFELRENVASCPVPIPMQRVQGKENTGILDTQ